MRMQHYSFINYVILALKRTTDFEGRSRRKEYWYFYIFWMIVSIFPDIIYSLSGVHNIFYKDTITTIKIIMLFPALAVGVRRLHDINHSGWWILVPLLGAVAACFDSDSGRNRFGASPKEDEICKDEEPVNAGAFSLDALEQIEQLARLRDKNILTEEEFQERKRKLLS